jgi:hypothetical protein
MCRATTPPETRYRRNTVMPALNDAFKSLFQVNMGIHAGERIEVFYRPTLTAIAADGAETILLRDGAPLFTTAGLCS